MPNASVFIWQCFCENAIPVLPGRLGVLLFVDTIYKVSLFVQLGIRLFLQAQEFQANQMIPNLISNCTRTVCLNLLRKDFQILKRKCLFFRGNHLFGARFGHVVPRGWGNMFSNINLIKQLQISNAGAIARTSSLSFEI